MQGVTSANFEQAIGRNPAYTSVSTAANVIQSHVKPDTVELQKTALNPPSSEKKGKKLLWGAFVAAAFVLAAKVLLFRKQPEQVIYSTEKMSKIARELFKDDKTDKSKLFYTHLHEYGDKIFKRENMNDLNGGVDGINALKYIFAAEKVGITEKFGKVPDVISVHITDKTRLVDITQRLANFYHSGFAVVDVSKDGADAIRKMNDVISNAKTIFKKDKTRTFVYVKGADALAKLQGKPALQVENFFLNCAADSGITTVVSKSELDLYKLKEPPEMELIFGNK